MLPSLYYLVPVLGGYAATSYYLLKNPHILHRRKRLPFYCRHISHRGGAGERIENTIAAFDNAVANHTDLLEMDLHLTKDGHVVVSHDGSLLRQTGHDVNICDVNYEDLPQYKETLEVTFLPGHMSSGNDRQIPQLEEVFQRYPEMPINIEIKTDCDELIKKVSDLVNKYQRTERTIWASTSNPVMKKCRKENPDMPFMFTPRRGIILLLLYYTGLLPFVPIPESVVEIYMPSIINRTYFPHNQLMRNRFLVRLQDKIMMRKGLFRHLQARGIQVYLWVLNQESDFQRAFKCGATGVMTDYPSQLHRFLQQYEGEQRARGPEPQEPAEEEEQQHRY
ncbi:PREDICTED: glycerophosphodiester phosphodiesterase domain-containing protein 1-like [Nanorana parkeri]|uniref:glycerophosphodiester phosphodiesterase domain-containing protein 1-like n=1 Tax=Nanorana parkeri TaxID=125878 RepID=UPI0008549C53|nr:PREDICTED: glycerophosphodiester phosphodiesterase domain-containing protein 1-like [Nanorana parkeri]